MPDVLRPSVARAAVLVFAVACVLRLGLLAVQGVSRESPEPVKIAIAVATRGQFADPWGSPTGPTAHAAPFYPYFLAALHAVFGPDRFRIAKEIAAVLTAAFACGLIPLAARRLGLPAAAGLIGGLGAALYPRMWLEVHGGFEAVWAAIFAMAGFMLTLAAFERPSWKRAAVCGCAWGAGFLVTPVLIPVCAGLLVLALARRRAAAWTTAVVIALAACLVVLPWTVRNWSVFHAPVAIRGNAGLEFAISNEDGAIPVQEWNMLRPGFRHPAMSAAERQRVAEIGEVRYSRERMREGLAWVRRNPGAFARLTAQRAAFFWFNPVNGLSRSLTLAALTATGLAGFVLLFRRDRWAAAAILVVWLSYWLPYCFFQVSPRYRYPIDWTFWLLAGYAVVRAARLRRSGIEQRDEAAVIR